jgi:hypothetical protein
MPNRIGGAIKAGWLWIGAAALVVGLVAVGQDRLGMSTTGILHWSSTLLALAIIGLLYRGGQHLSDIEALLRGRPISGRSGNAPHPGTDEPKPQGGGAFVGMVAGGALGAPFGPLGVLIGGILGAVVGNQVEYDELNRRKGR